MTATPSTRDWLGYGAIAAVAVVLISFPTWLPPYYLTTVTRILFYGMLAMSLSFLAGQVGMVSLAQTGLFGVAGYTLAILSVHYGLPFPYPLMVALLGTVLLAALFGVVSMRTYGTYFLILTLALGQILWAMAQQWTSVTEGFDGIQGIRAPTFAWISFTEPDNFYWALLVVFLICFATLRAVIRSPFGLALRGIRENPVRMAALGYRVDRLRLYAFVLASVPAALAGTFFVQFGGIITPASLGLDRTVWILLIVILGGVGSLLGTVFGVVLALMFEVVVTRFTDRYLTAMGVTFLLLVLFAPNGIMGAVDALRARYGRRRKATSQPEPPDAPGAAYLAEGGEPESADVIDMRPSTTRDARES
jgi:branched-chain amino acid transport system permease protein